jgi:uncharacterized membrane protein
MTRRPLIAAGILTGAGLGGFIDGIAFHQILQIHNMLSARIPPDTLVNAKINMVWDGFFHALTWGLTAWGIAALWGVGQRADVPWSGRTFAGSLLMGWGLFNLIEGLIDHHLIGIHHVVERLHASAYDYAFLVFGALLLLIGAALVRAARHDERPRLSPAMAP